MAESPAHKFGQIIGNLLEETMRPLLQEFCGQRGFYLDAKGKRTGVRKGTKVTWSDRYGNHHDLDFVIEKDASATQQGRPLAFIEAAWRRYTKHSKNKTQEIQAAILPIAEKYQWDRPFLGAILAGVFTQNAIEQLQSFGFSVLYFEYESIVLAFEHVGIEVRFDESTTDRKFADCIQAIHALSDRQYSNLKAFLLQNNQDSVDVFLQKMGEALDRVVDRLVIIPLHGSEYLFSSCAEAIGFIDKFEPVSKNHSFRKYEVMVRLSNGDGMQASFKDKQGVEKFLKYLGS